MSHGQLGTVDLGSVDVGQHRKPAGVTTRARRGFSKRWAAAFVFALTTGVAWAYWGASSEPGGNGASAATTVNQGATPTASVAGNAVTVAWAASTLSNGDAVSGYIIKRYDVATVTEQTILSACTGTVTGTTCTEETPTGEWLYSVTPVFSTSWTGTESLKSNTATVVVGETTPPVNAISVSVVTGNAAKSSNTIFYRGTAAGSFKLINALTDAGTGPASSSTATLTGTTTGWTHTPSTVSTPVGGPFFSNTFTWSSATTSAPTEVVTGRDVGGNAAGTTLSFVNDSTAPTAGTVSYPAGYQAGRSVDVTFTTGTDSGSGLGARQLQRSSAPLTSGTCGTYSSFANLGAASPTSPYTDSLVTNGVCYKYRYLVTDLVGNQHIATSANEVKVDYAGAVNSTTGLLSQWRLGEAVTSSDSFTGSSGTDLTSHTGETGATWQYEAGSSSTAERISNANRARRNGTGYSINNTTATPPSADYSVESDLYVASNLAGDMAGVIGRLDTGNTSFYMARWQQSNTSWNLIYYSGGTATSLASVTGQPALTVGATYRVRLGMVGTALKLYVNGVPTLSATHSTLTSAGKAGIMDGYNGGSASKSDTTGLHFDNFQVTRRAADSKGSNPGDYFNGVTLSATGALAADANTAATFDGVNDYVQAVGTTGIPVGASLRSAEMWFKTSSAARQVLFAYGSLANTQEFGLWLNAGSASMTAWGSGSGNDKTFTLASAVNDGAWHQVVKTYDGTSITLYIDGVALTPQAATRATVMDSYGFGIGAIINPGDANSGGYFNGSLDEVSFYTTALDQTTVTNHYQLGTSSAPDGTGPTGGSVAASGLVGTGALYSTSSVLSLDLATGTDPSGVGGSQLLRATATLTSAGTANGTCGTYGTYTLITGGTDPDSPKSDIVADQACYKYQYIVADTLGNSTTYTSSDIKVDTTAPAAPTLTFGTFTNAYWSSGSTVFYRSAAASGSFRATVSASDTKSGIVSYAFPALGTNWTSTPVSAAVNTYAWTVSPAASGTSSVTVTNNATLTSAGTSFTLTADDTAPTASTVSYFNGVQTSTSVSVSFTTGTDTGGSGIGTRLLQRASATLTGSTCGTFGAFSTRSTNPATSPYNDSVTTGNCYMYQYVVPDNVGNSTTATSTDVVKVDAAGPTGGSVAASGLVGTGSLYSTSTTLSLDLATGTDPSGIATTGNLLRRATATLTSGGTADGTCGTYGTYSLISGGTDPVSPKSDTVTDQACYKYQYVVADTLGNSTTYTSSDIKVDTTAPAAPTLTFGTFTNTYWSSGSTVFYRSAAASGSFRATVSASDTKSGIASYEFPALGTNWTSTPVSTTVNTYAWTVTPAASGTSSVTATNNATLTSAGTSFTLTADDTAPADGTVTYLNGAQSGTSVSVSFTSGTDAGSGIATASRVLQRASATLTGGTCGAFGSFATVTNGTNPTSPLSNTVTLGNCYKYQYVVPDNVGNQDTVTSAGIVKISSDVTGPTGGSVAASGLVGTGSLYSTSTTLSLNLAKGTDTSGVATTGNELLRATATLTSGTCGTYGSYSLITGGTDPASPKSDTVADQACYKYQYVVEDTLGHPTTYTSSDIKVDTTAPDAPSLSFGTFTNTYWSGSGSTVFYRSAAASGSFRATASSTDTASGIASYAFPTLGTNWTSTPVSLGVNTYSWSGSPAAPGTKSVTATNNATDISAGTSFTLTADNTAPGSGTVTPPNTTTTNTSVSVSFTTGTDAGSGLGTRLLQRQSATLTGTTCGTYGSFATVTGGTNPTSPLVDTVTAGNCYKYQYVVSDNVGNSTTATSANVVKVAFTYLDTINGTAGLVSYWRLGDSGTASDTFTGSTGDMLQSHTAEIGSPWTKHAASTTDAVITNSDRVRKNGSSTLGALYYSAGVPASADYTVEADAYRPSSSEPNDVIGVVGRLDTTNALGTYYGAVYDLTAGDWVLYRMNNGVKTSLGTYTATFSSATTYRVSLDMNGSTIRLLLDGTQRISVTNTSITAAGRAGVTMGFGASNTTVDNTNGMHLDNFTVSTTLADSWGTNTGDYLSGPTLGVAGAITGDSDTAATFDGSNDYASVTRQISDDFSIEFWFKSTQGIGTSTTWSSGAGLVDADVSGTSNDFGVSLRSDGYVVAGVGGGSNTSIMSAASGYDDGTWHHVVFTRDRSSGALRLYIDGGTAVTGTGSTTLLTSPANINFGRLQSGTNYYLGSLDEVAVYNTVLSAATVTAHYSAAP